MRTEVDDVEAAASLAHLLIDRISELVLIDDHELRVSTSINISVFPRDGLDHHVLFKKADIALYRAKGEGRATYRVFEPGMDERLNRRAMLEDDLRDALDADALQVHFQPQFESATRRGAGFEALARWDHPKYGWVPPAIFVAVAEECGLISRLGSFVLEEACKTAMAWASDCFIAVNVSAFQLLDAGFVDLVTGVLARTGFPAGRLEAGTDRERDDRQRPANRQHAGVTARSWRQSGVGRLRYRVHQPEQFVAISLRQGQDRQDVHPGAAPRFRGAGNSGGNPGDGPAYRAESDVRRGRDREAIRHASGPGLHADLGLFSGPRVARLARAGTVAARLGHARPARGNGLITHRS